ncbi:MAG: glycosyltransferase [Candidatus Sulfomarinibacteraceae bacterium]
MSRLLILGSGPLLFENANRTYAAGARTWQITEPLIADGHEVLLVGQRLPLSYPDDLPPEMTVREEDRFVYRSVHPTLFQSEGYLERLSRDFGPDAVVYPHASASFLSRVFLPAQPIWIDINGHVMTEAQAKSAVYEDDDFLDHFYGMELDMLAHGDVFSTCCDPQTWALLGELGLAGRLNSLTNDRLLVESVPVGVSDEEYKPTGRAFRGLDVPESAFVVLWSGGYNTWTDVDTMFEGLERAMSVDSSVHFVSTGGQIDGHDEFTYPHFCDLVNGSQFRDRFHLRGWIPREEVPNYYLEADIGLNCEKPILEVAFGSKQRILDWSRAALPCVSSRLTELSRVLEEEGIGLIFAPGDGRELGRLIAEAAADPDKIQRLGERGRLRLRERFAYAKTMAPFLEWARSPWSSPDRNRGRHCLEKTTAELEETRADAESLRRRVEELTAEVTRLRALERAHESHPQPGDDPGAAQPPADESMLSWAARVTRTSFRQGGVTLVVRRFLSRATGRGRDEVNG